ncbi:hypothetical protein KK107_14075 [Clavibacter michiganensis]|nr:hypothetical protein [Clavibacter michiganensis]
MTILLPEIPGEVILQMAFLGSGLVLLALGVVTPLAYIVLFGKNGTPAKRLSKILKSWPRKP